MAVSIYDVFRPEQSDFEVGDVYEKFGYKGVFELEKQRKMVASGLIVPENHIALDVAQAFGCSPGDLYYDENDGVPFDPAAMAAYYMGQGA